MMWEFEDYTVYEETDVLRFENHEGDVIGYVVKNGDQEVEALDGGDTPIEDKWEDGVGNTLNIIGWGEEEPKDIETIYERLRAVLNVDGENGKYMTLYNDAEELKERSVGHDFKDFENEFNVNVNELLFPVIIFDDKNATGGHVFDSRNDLSDIEVEAFNYFNKKY